MSAASVRAQHADWLSALEGDGPWLTVPALTERLNAGLIPTTSEQNKALRHAWNAHITAAPANAAAAQRAWIRSVVADLLGWGDHADFDHSDRWALTDPVHGITVTPGFALLPIPAGETGDAVTPVILGFTHPTGTPLTKRVGDGWATTPIDRAAHALRAADVPLGLVTDGRWWGLLWAPRPVDGAAATPGHALWSTDLLLDDDLLRSAFVTLLSRHRSLAVAEAKNLRGLFEKSAQSQEDITENLSIQTRKAVELLVDAFSIANNRAGGAYLDGVDADHVYQGAVTVMMRLIFALAAEERRLLPGDDDLYVKTYSIAALADRIIDRGNLHSEDLLADTVTAFPQILATTRVIHDGIHHNRLNIPGYGGSVFDPHRFPWLERAPANPALGPIGVDDRTMLHILRGLTRWDGRRLSYRTLDVEQIGYAYEGLLDHTAILATTPVLGLIGKKEPEVPLDNLEIAAARGQAHLVKRLNDLTGDTPAQVSKRFDAGKALILDAGQRQRLVAACAGDTTIADRVAPWLPLLRTDGRAGLPIVINPGTIYVTASSARGDTGAHYTPRTLAEDVVKQTLDALVQSPGPLDSPDESIWQLVHPDKILDLKVADIAMGSGAFLVAAIRYLADRLLEALDVVERHDLSTTALTDLWDISRRANDRAEWDNSRDDESLTSARAVIAAHCVYGVDVNPMAVEMAKLSIWLVTASRNKPFGYLDHRLAVGDSLLGIHELSQIENLHFDPRRGADAYARQEGKFLDLTSNVRRAVTRVTELHRQIEKKRVIDSHDIDEQMGLFVDAVDITADLKVIADGLVGASLAAGRDRAKGLDGKIGLVEQQAEVLLATGTAVEERGRARSKIESLAGAWLEYDLPDGAFRREPLHWPLAFPEIFGSDRPGFDAVIGNPPFLGGLRITEVLGDAYNTGLAAAFPPFSKRVDLCALFFRRAASLLRRDGTSTLGLLATNSISQGTTRRGGLDVLVAEGWRVYSARKDFPWPTKASVVVSQVHMTTSTTKSATLDGRKVLAINSLLDDAGSSGTALPFPLLANRGKTFAGSVPWGDAFFLTDEEAQLMLADDARNAEVLKHAMGGTEFNSAVDFDDIDRWVIDMGERTEAEAVKYALPFERLERGLRKTRMGLDPKKYGRINPAWWKYFHARMELYKYIRRTGAKRIMARARVSDAHVLDLVPTGDWVYLDTLTLFLTEDVGDAAVLQSSVHDVWARNFASTLGSGMRYGADNCFNNFPFPLVSEAIRQAGVRWLTLKAAIKATRSIGNRQVIELVHDSETNYSEVVELRDHLETIDRLVASSYGWGQSMIEHEFVVLGGGLKYSLSERSRRAVIGALTGVNHERHSAEVAARLVDQAGKPLVKRSDIRKAMQPKKAVEGQFDMFGEV